MGNRRVGADTRSDSRGPRAAIAVAVVGADVGPAAALADELAEDDGFEVRRAADPEAGLELVQSAPIESVVSAYRFTHDQGTAAEPAATERTPTGGLEFLEQVREIHAEMPFVLVTDVGSEAVASAAVSAGVTEYVRAEDLSRDGAAIRERIQDAVADYRARLELDESEQRYRTVVENSHEGVYIYSGDEMLFANDRITELTGYQRAELESIEIWDLLHPEDRDRVQEIARKRAASDETAPSTYEARVMRKDGSIRHCEFAVQEITYRGQFAALGSVRDITERRERRRQLERYETMVNVSADPMYTLDEEGHFTVVNDRLCEITGYERSELVGSHVSMLMAEADVERGEAVIAELLAQEELAEATFEMSVFTASGDRIESENHVALLPRQDGGFQGTVGVVRDIGERKRRERRLTRLHEAATQLGRADTEATVYRELVAAGRDILDFDFVSVDSVEGDWLRMQETASLDVDPEYFETVPLDASDNLAARSAVEGEPSLVEDLRTVDVSPADPEYRSALTVPVGDRAVFQAGSKDVGAFDELDRETSEVLAEHARTALENIEARTQLREQQAALERENERLDEFASLVSHDLRNPLTVASGRLADARSKSDSEELAAAAHALDRIDRLIGDLLDLARHGQRVEDVSPVSLEGLVDRCWANVSTEAADLTVESDATVLADEGRLAQLFENLFRNSVEHGRPAGQDQEPISIHVGTLPDGFYVEDDGRGIPAEERETVFETGYTSTEDGTGFGLSIVEQVAAAHGWSVAATESESGGARFEFTSVASPARESS